MKIEEPDLGVSSGADWNQSHKKSEVTWNVLDTAWSCWCLSCPSELERGRHCTRSAAPRPRFLKNPPFFFLECDCLGFQIFLLVEIEFQREKRGKGYWVFVRVKWEKMGLLFFGFGFWGGNWNRFFAGREEMGGKEFVENDLNEKNIKWNINCERKWW